MGYPYHFVNLSDEQSARRRHLLDSYGQFAQLSILLVPLLYYLLRALKLIVSRLWRHQSYEPVKQHTSSTVSKFVDNNIDASGSKWAQIQWALSEEVSDGWGTRQEWLIAGLWAVWLGILATRDTGDDYLHQTRRFGIIAASQLPLHYALALKSWSPIQFLTRRSHEELNVYHRLLGRIIYVLLFLHATFYLNFYVQKGLLAKRIRDWDVILGLSAVTTASLLLTGALQKVRDWNYRVFFYSHVALSIFLLPILYLHVSHLRLYILETVSIYGLLILQRNLSQLEADTTIALIPRTSLIAIKIPLKGTPLARKHFSPGQHMYVGFPELKEKLRINPFSIANSNPTKENHIQLVARTLSGTTAQLASLSQLPQPTRLTIEGPYGSTAYFPDLLTYNMVLLAAGGVGATFTLPLYSNLLRRMASGETGTFIRFVWTVKSSNEARWGIDLVRNELDAIPYSIELYVTEGSKNDDREGIEMLECEHSASGGSIRKEAAQDRMIMRSGRPDLKSIVDGNCNHNPHGRMAVLVCGPQGMGKSLRREVGRWVSKGKEVFWHNEEFGW